MIWKDVPWYEWSYMVSNKWDIKSLWRYQKSKWWKLYWKSEIILKYKINKWYKRVVLMKDSIRKDLFVHRIVATAFLNNELIFNWHNLVCHKNDDRADNRIENLYIGTYQDNNRDCISKNRWVDNKWEKHGMCKLSEERIYTIRKLLYYWYTQSIIANMFNINQSHISRISRNLSRKIY